MRIAEMDVTDWIDTTFVALWNNERHYLDSDPVKADQMADAASELERLASERGRRV